MPSTQSSRQSAPSQTSAELLGQHYPPLQTLWPNLRRVSAPQAAFLLLPQKEAFYGGAAGGGKSDALLAGAVQYADRPGYAALILRRTFSDLALPGAAMARAHEWLGGSARWNDREKTWTFPSGATLTFGYLENENDMFRYKSSEFQYIGFDELTQFSEKQYRYLFTRLRAVETVQAPLRMRSASNPGDIGHGWVKRRFITDRAPATIFVPAKLDDHPDETFKAGYRSSLAELDEVTRRQYEDGDWDVAEGLAFNVSRAHLIAPFDLPEPWERFESMDFGVANPTCVLAWAVDYDGNCIIFDSYYQGNTLVSEHARQIEARRKLWGTTLCFADPSMWAKKGGVSRFGEPATDVTEFEDNGIRGLTQANNRRRPGRGRLIELLKPRDDRLFPAYHPNAGEAGSPGLFIVADRCPELVEQLQDAPLMSIESGKEGAGEVVDPDWETHHGHAVAAARYGAMSRPAPSVMPEEIPDDPRVELMRRVEQQRSTVARYDWNP